MRLIFKRFLRVWGFGPDRLRLQSEWRVTRLDRIETYVRALLEIHPELETHPSIIDLRERQQAYEEELKR